MRKLDRSTLFLFWAALFQASPLTAAEETRVVLTPDVVVNESERGNPQAMVDEQDLIGDPPSGEPENTWQVKSNYWKTFPSIPASSERCEFS